MGLFFDLEAHLNRVNMDKWVRLSIVAGVLMAGFGVFYHFVFFLPSIEREKAEAAKAKEEASQKAEAARKATYSVCMVMARRDYDANWAAACRSVAKQKAGDLQNCLADPSIINNQFMGRAYCQTTYGDADPSPTCTLPGPRAETVNGYLRAAEEKCVTEAKLGL